MGQRMGLWTEVTTSPHLHERAALAFLRERLPDREPFRVWANFTFIPDDGTRNEVDLFVVTPGGVYLVEIKSHPGRMLGDAGTWTWITPDGTRRTLDNPLHLAERKAKKLKSLLLHQSPFRDPAFRNGFYLQPLIFLSNRDLAVDLNAAGRTNVYGPDPVEGESQRNDLPGVAGLLTRIDPRRGRLVDRPLSLAIARAMDRAGIRESTAHRRVGIYELAELLDEGRGWQDFASEHPQARGTHRRIRIYLAGRAHTEEEREALVRAANREFRFLQGIDHPGIERPLDLLPNPRGPALLFPHDPSAQRLDHWLADNGDILDLGDRIELVRSLAETLRHAHRQGLYHRALAPQHITVTERKGRAHLRIRDWQTAAHDFTSTTGGGGTVHVSELVSEQARVYLAPEALRLPDFQPGPADIWSLGAVAFLILSGQPPAPDADSLHSVLRQEGRLSLAAVMDAPARELDFVIGQATMVDAASRFVSVDEFVEHLDDAFDRLTRPEEPDPLDAAKGAEIAGEWTVLRRYGTGSTSVVLLAERDGRKEILKVARDDAHAKRLRGEHEVLRTLRNRTIVEVYGLEEIAGRAVLRLEAALGTLAEELRQNGPLSLDLLERFGTDLLDALVVLDEEGVSHRDIKPDNLGIAERGKNDERHLVLFDFSLARTNPTDLRAGTLGYLDPFLEEREPRRWDAHAERYAAAVTLYEMATGTRPVWGDGSTDPWHTDLTLPTIDEALLDPGVRDPLVAFFEQALHRRPERRFDTAGDMRRAWRAVFAGVDRAPGDRDGQAAEDIDLAEVTAATPLAELALRARVRNALERVDVVTAGDLAAIPASRLVRLAGIGAMTRREITHLAGRVRERIGEAAVLGDAGAASVDRIAGQLVPRPPADEDHRTAIAALLAVLDDPAGAWPTQRAVVEQTGLGRAVVADALASARTRWRKRLDVNAVRDEIVDLLLRREGVAGGDELAAALLTTRGSLAADPVRSRRARAVVRAAAEAEAGLQEPRFVIRRVGEAVLLVLDGEAAGDDGINQWDADLLTEAAAALGEVADRLARERPLPTLDRALTALREVALPEGTGPFKDARLVRLAAAASDHVAVSPRLELYPKRMTAEEAVEAARGALLDRSGLDPDEVRARVRARFPDAETVPGRPSLDRLLEPLGLAWDGERGCYVLPARGGILSTTFTTAPSTSTFRTPDERDAAVRDLEERLDRLRRDGGFLALTVDRRHLPSAGQAVVSHLGGTLIDLDGLLIAAMREQAAARNARWSVLVAADAAPRSDRRWALLQRLVDLSLPAVEERLCAVPGVAVVTGLGLLARYDRMAVLERLRDTLTRGPAEHPLTGLAVLVPGDDPSARPVIDGRPIPVVTANHWAHLPGAWLQQRHEGEAA